jgi:hypothetical protein
MNRYKGQEGQRCSYAGPATKSTPASPHSQTVLLKKENRVKKQQSEFSKSKKKKKQRP